jgi:hypothetical protein
MISGKSVLSPVKARDHRRYQVHWLPDPLRPLSTDSIADDAPGHHLGEHRHSDWKDPEWDVAVTRAAGLDPPCAPTDHRP